jgi:two-component sensor histidine kinase
MALLNRLVEERTDLDRDDVVLLAAVVAEWSLLADLGLSDLVLWVPTWNDSGLVAVAQVRPTTASTQVPDDVVGAFSPRGRHAHLDQAAAFGRAVLVRDGHRPWLPIAEEAYPIRRAGRVIAVVARHAAAPRVAGQLEDVYLSTADDLLGMLVDGSFPAAETGDGLPAPRVGDGLLRLDAGGTVTYASPNAVSALRRLGLAADVVGANLAEVAVRLTHRPGPLDESIAAVAGGRRPGRVDIENTVGVMLVRGVPLTRGEVRVGAVLFVQDVTDARRRERALLGKDATIREIHHRVKNNLQTVAAMLRLQARRAESPQAREALAEAQLRVASIAVVHDLLSAHEGEDVDADDVLDRVIDLVRELAPGYAEQPPSIRRTGTWGSLSAHLATAMAMVAAELLHNAVEHAGASTVVVTASRDAAGTQLVVADDGSGFPEDVDLSTGLGLTIVGALVTDDLGGTVEWGAREGGGAEVRVAVPGT